MELVTEGVDLSNGAFPYMHVRTGQIAGVGGCVLWRIGFTGELSYELHVPAGYGLHVWETLLERGAALGAAAFGVEAQRMLRLEKGHMIVGQDTDGLTRGFSAGLDWAIKLDKDDFVGKPELAWQCAAESGPRLVALQPVDGKVVPEEASLIMDGGRIAGRVTSSKMSPTLRRSVCLAQVEPRLAAPGTEVTVRLPSGHLVSARVMPHLAHVDPGGERMRA
jgi:sarcosine oxidase subunit alpha